MLDGDFVQFLEALRLGHSVVDHHGVDLLHVGDADKLVDGGVVALIALERRVCRLPLLVRHAKQGNIQHISLACIDDVHLGA